MSSDSSVTGWYPNEPGLSPADVASGDFGEIFDTQLNGQIYAQPLVNQPIVLAVTENDYAYGLNSTTGTIEWQKSFGTPDDPLANIGCGDVGSSLGITGTPVIDSVTHVAYFVSAQEGVGGTNTFFMEAVNVLTGASVSGWPVGGVPIVGSADDDSGTVFNPNYETQRPGLVLVNGVVYATFGSQCDYGNWEGWVVGVSEAAHSITTMWSTEEKVGDTGFQLPGAGIWQSGSAPVVDSNGDIFVSTGNGDIPSGPEPGTDASNSTYGEAVVKLHTNTSGHLEPVDWFIPADAVSLNSQDGDLGSGGPVELPASMSTSGDPDPMVIDGKAGIMYVLNSNNLGGYEQGSGGTDDVESESAPYGGVWGKASVWPGDGGYVYIANAGLSPFGTNGGALNAFQRTDTAGTLTLPLVAATSNSGNVFGFGAGSPIVTSNGTTSGSALVWIIHATGGGTDSQLQAYNAVPVNPGSNGTLEEVWSSAPFTSTVFSQPSVDNGILYVGTKDDTLLGFGTLPSSIPAIAGTDLSFGPTVLDQSSAPLTETFTATAPTRLSSFTVSGASFSLGAPSLTLPASLSSGESISVPVTFTPQMFGSNAGTLTVNATGETASIELGGEGNTTNPSLSFSPNVIAFTPQPIGGASQSQSETVTNISSSPIIINSFVWPAAPFYANLPATPLTLNPSGQSGDSFTFTVTFPPPGSSGDFDHDYASLTTIVTSVGSFGVAISGSADPPAQIATVPSTLSFGNVAVGSSATLNFELGDQGGFPLTITSSTPPATNGFSALTDPFVQLAGTGGVIAPDTSIQESVQFAPTSSGSFTSTWLLEGDDGSGVQTVTLTGTGYTPSSSPPPSGPTTPTTLPTPTPTTLPPSSPPPTKTHAATLTITTRSERGRSLALRTSGDRAGGVVTFSVRPGSAKGCRVRGSVLRARSVGTCIVIATRAARGSNPAVRSRPTVVTFAARRHHL